MGQQSKLHNKRRYITGALDNRGFTLIESFMAAAVMSFVCLTFWITMIFVFDQKQADTLQMELTNDSRIVMEKMSLGFIPENDPNNLRDGLRGATGFTYIGTNEIHFTGLDGLERRYRVTDQDIEYYEVDEFGNGGWFTLYSPGDASEATTSVNFTASDASVDVVDIELVIGKRLAGRWYYASLHSQIAARN